MSAALAVLQEAGAHFVLVGAGPDGRQPIERGYLRRRPPLALVEKHHDQGRSIGIVPASIGTSALDVDHGDPSELVTLYPPRVSIPSRRHGRRHGYYDDDQPRGNPKWKAHGAAGEIRSGKGFLILYGDAPERLVTALARPGRYPWPGELFPALPEHHAPIERGAGFVAGRPDVLPMLGAMREGHRNTALFDVVRWWAYAQDRGEVYRDWRRIVLDYAMQRNQEFPLPLPSNPTAKDGPLPDDEVAHLAHSISSRTWKATGAVDHSPPAQRRRALKGGVVRRAENRPRDAAILQDAVDGMSLRAIGRKHGLSGRAVHHIVKRDSPLLPVGVT